MTSVFITDHALIRYLERVVLMDLEPYRAETAALVRREVEVRAKHAQIGEFHAVLDGAKVVTFMPGKPSSDSGSMRRNTVEHIPEPMPWQAKARKRAHK